LPGVGVFFPASSAPPSVIIVIPESTRGLRVTGMAGELLLPQPQKSAVRADIAKRTKRCTAGREKRIGQ
jgi:hypothetical protein